MRKLFFFVSSSLIAVVASVQACGSTEDASSPADAGTDAVVTETGPADTGAKDGGSDSQTPCDTSKDFLADVPDADIADGASSSGVCLGCLQKNCKASLDMCNVDCNCRSVVSGALDCYTKGGDVLQCVLGGKTQPTQKTIGIGTNLFGCLNTSCNDQCAVDELLPPDGGDAGDGGDGG